MLDDNDDDDDDDVVCIDDEKREWEGEAERSQPLRRSELSQLTNRNL